MGFRVNEPPRLSGTRLCMGTILSLTCLGTHLFVKVPRPGDSEGTFSVFTTVKNYADNCTSKCLGLGTHLFVKVLRPGDSEVTVRSSESSCHLLLPF